MLLLLLLQEEPTNQSTTDTEDAPFYYSQMLLSIPYLSTTGFLSIFLAGWLASSVRTGQASPKSDRDRAGTRGSRERRRVEIEEMS